MKATVVSSPFILQCPVIEQIMLIYLSLSAPVRRSVCLGVIQGKAR
jgi:hypothetical protein